MQKGRYLERRTFSGGWQTREVLMLKSRREKWILISIFEFQIQNFKARYFFAFDCGVAIGCLRWPTR